MSELGEETEDWLAGRATAVEHVVDGLACPSCGKRLDRHSGGAAPPAPESITICIECAAPLQFDEHLALRELTAAELGVLPADVLDAVNELRSIVLFARRT